MVEMNDSACNRIRMLDVSALAEIASTAGQGPVVCSITTAAHERNAMLNLKWEVENRFRGMAVLATVTCS
jgi:hypothetical protein